MDDDFFEDFDIGFEMDEEEQAARIKQQEEYIVAQYKEQEEMMILIFAQWCVNNDIDPESLYKKAHPEQMRNQVLTDALKSTVPKEESDDIPYDLVLEALQSFGNVELAFVVEEAAQQVKSKEDID